VVKGSIVVLRSEPNRRIQVVHADMRSKMRRLRHGNGQLEGAVETTGLGGARELSQRTLVFVGCLDRNLVVCLKLCVVLHVFDQEGDRYSDQSGEQAHQPVHHTIVAFL